MNFIWAKMKIHFLPMNVKSAIVCLLMLLNVNTYANVVLEGFFPPKWNSVILVLLKVYSPSWNNYWHKWMDIFCKWTAKGVLLQLVKNRCFTPYGARSCHKTLTWQTDYMKEHLPLFAIRIRVPLLIKSKARQFRLNHRKSKLIVDTLCSVGHSKPVTTGYSLSDSFAINLLLLIFGCLNQNVELN